MGSIARAAEATVANTVFSIHKPREVLRFVRGAFKYPIQYQAAKLHGMIPAETFASMFPEVNSVDVRLERSRLDRHGWNVKLHEEILLGEIGKAIAAKSIFEIGTFDGGTTLRLAESSPADTSIYTLDLPESAFDATQSPSSFDGSRVGEKFINSPYVSRIKQIRADAAKFDFSQFDGQIDFIFVDAAHDYPNGIRDSRNALRMVKPGGVIVWHDFEPYWSGLVRAICEMTEGMPLRRLAGTSLAVLRTE